MGPILLGKFKLCFQQEVINLLLYNTEVSCCNNKDL